MKWEMENFWNIIVCIHYWQYLAILYACCNVCKHTQTHGTAMLHSQRPTAVLQGCLSVCPTPSLGWRLFGDIYLLMETRQNRDTPSTLLWSQSCCELESPPGCDDLSTQDPEHGCVHCDPVAGLPSPPDLPAIPEATCEYRSHPNS